MSELTRAALLSRGTKSGISLLLAGSVAGSLAGVAAADTIPDEDLAYARLLIGGELLAADFYAKAIASKKFNAAETKTLRAALKNEQDHYATLAKVMTDAGQPPATAEDFDFTYPKNAFATKGSIARLGVGLESTFLSTYLGAVNGLLTSALKLPAAQIAASESDHLSIFNGWSGRSTVGASFPPPLAIDAASDALDAYTS